MGQPSELRVLRGDTIHGPFTHDQIRELVARGRLTASELVSVRGGPWVRITEYLRLVQPTRSKVPPPPPAPPPEFDLTESAPPAGAPADSHAIDWTSILGWAYRGLLALAIVGIFSPWYTARVVVSSSLVGVGGQSSITGLLSSLGILSLLFLVGGEVASILTRAWKVHCGLAAASFGLAVLGAAQLSAAGPFGLNVESAFGDATASVAAGLGWGIWLTIAASVAATGVAYCTGSPAIRQWLDQWSTNPLLCHLGHVGNREPSVASMDRMHSSTRVANPVSPVRTKWLGPLAVLGVALTGAAFGWSLILDQITPISRANFERLRPGMTVSQVRVILGNGEEIESSSLGVPEQSVNVLGSGGVSIPGTSLHVPGGHGFTIPGQSISGGVNARVVVPGLSVSSQTIRWRLWGREIVANFVNGQLYTKRQSGLGSMN